MADKTATEQGREFLRLFFGDIPQGHVIEIKAVSPDGTVTQRFLVSPEQYDLKVFNPLARVWFGIALRDETDHKIYTLIPSIWTDHDKVEDKQARISRLRDKFDLPPTIIVDSGGGLHAYWKLSRMLDARDKTDAAYAREIAYGLATALGADKAIYDLARVMGVPGSQNIGNGNTKIYDPPRLVRVVSVQPNCTYQPQDLSRYRKSLAKTVEDSPVVVFHGTHADVVLRLDDEYMKLVRDGTNERYDNDRSRADQAVIARMLMAGHTPDEILAVFSDPSYKIGEKFREPKNGKRYLERSISSAQVWIAQQKAVRELLPNVREMDGVMQGFRKEDKGTWETIFEGTIVPKAVVEGEASGFHVEVSNSTDSRRLVLKTTDFATSVTVRKELNKVGGWYGNDRDGQALLDYLRRHEGLPTVRLLRKIGLHKDTIIFANGVLQDGTVVEGTYVFEGEVMDRPQLRVNENWPALAKAVANTWPHIQRMPVMIPLIGWTLAAFAAPWVRRLAEGTFPLLMVWGSAKAGKTQTLLRSWRLHGMDTEMEPWSAVDTKPFSLMTYISESNTVPVILDEYRRNELPHVKAKINAYLREAYNGATKTLGRPDLTLRRFSLTAPIVIAGETPFGPSDAMQDRTIHVEMRAEDQQPEPWGQLNTLPLHEFNVGFYTHIMQKDMTALWREAQEWVPSDLRKLSRRQADAWTTVAFGLRLMEPFWSADQAREWIGLLSAQREQAHDEMPDVGLVPEIMAVMHELIRAQQIKDVHDYVIRDNGHTLWFIPATVLRNVEQYSRRLGTEHPLTRETMMRALKRDMGTAQPTVLRYQDFVKIAGRAVRAVQIDLDRIESRDGIPITSWYQAVAGGE